MKKHIIEITTRTTEIAYAQSKSTCYFGANQITYRPERRDGLRLKDALRLIDRLKADDARHLLSGRTVRTYRVVTI